MNALLKKFINLVVYDGPYSVFCNNQRYMRSVLFPASEHLSLFRLVDGNRLNIYLQNQQYMPLRIDYLTWQDLSVWIRLFSCAGFIKRFLKAKSGVQLYDTAEYALGGSHGRRIGHYNLLGLALAPKATPTLGNRMKPLWRKPDFGESTTAKLRILLSFIKQRRRTNTITYRRANGPLTRIGHTLE